MSSLKQRRLSWIVTGSILLIGGALLFFGARFLPGLLAANRLLPEEEPFTELYFEDHQKLPLLLEEDQVASASFTIVNRENRQTPYLYEVVKSATNEAARVISSGSATLENDEKRTVRFLYTAATEEAKTRIQVRLRGMDQQIHFWINNRYQQ